MGEPSDDKRPPPDEFDSPDPKRRRVEDDSPHLFDAPDANLIQGDLLDILDDSDGDPPIPDLESVIKSFEEEIVVPWQDPTPTDPDPALNELGYLLEASDDELGLPPSFAGSVDVVCDPEIQEFHGVCSSAFSSPPFDGEMPNYDGFDLGPEVNSIVASKEVGGNEEFVMLGGLFDFTDSYDVPEVMWRPESLPAV